VILSQNANRIPVDTGCSSEVFLFDREDAARTIVRKSCSLRRDSYNAPSVQRRWIRDDSISTVAPSTVYIFTFASLGDCYNRDILLTTFLAPTGQRIPDHAPRATFEEILESPTLCGSILTISNASQKQSSSDSRLCMCGWRGTIHTLAYFGWVRWDSFGNASSGDSDSGGSKPLQHGIHK
jgi:hypothetical protein